MRQRMNNDYLTVVFKLPDEQGMPLFHSEFLFWMRPGRAYLYGQLSRCGLELFHTNNKGDIGRTAFNSTRLKKHFNHHCYHHHQHHNHH